MGGTQGFLRARQPTLATELQSQPRFSFKQRLIMQTRLASHLQSSCLSCLSASLTGVCPFSIPMGREWEKG